MTFKEWQDFAGKVNGIASRTSRAITNRARQACGDAGLDRSLLGIHPHNAMVSFRAGDPWKGIDYSKVRLCEYLIRKSWEPGRMASRIIDRAWKRVTQ